VPAKQSRLDLEAVLRSLYNLGITKVLCEGGAQLAAGLIEARLVDDLQWFLAPKLLLDSSAKDALALDRALLLKDALKIDLFTCRPIGGDILVSGLLKYD
jgi:diaminohydroxyphosphoribosylaminopyrimidine deaminase/5-amino-6-(5-phosphoribosylamino)uracil reductase